MIMPFEDKFFEVYEMLKREFDKDFIFSHAGDEDNQQNILKDIIQAIYEADIIVADLTGLNANVFYELGVAHTLNKKVIIITEDISSLPFDLKSYRAKEYSTHFVKFAELIDALNKYLYGAISDGIIYSNPVSDFLSTKNEEEIVKSIHASNNDILLSEDTEKGFLDFMAGIEENMSYMTDYINEMSDDLQTMTDNVNESTEKINNVGGNGSASFVRKEAKKVASYMGTFSTNLRRYNSHYTDLWSQIEKDILGLLENKYASQNTVDLISFLKSLRWTQNKIAKSCLPVQEMKNASLGNLGMERSLNQAIRFLDEDLKNYLSIMEQIRCSIDRILEKSRFVVGQIEFDED